MTGRYVGVFRAPTASGYGKYFKVGLVEDLDYKDGHLPSGEVEM